MDRRGSLSSSPSIPSSRRSDSSSASSSAHDANHPQHDERMAVIVRLAEEANRGADALVQRKYIEAHAILTATLAMVKVQLERSEEVEEDHAHGDSNSLAAATGSSPRLSPSNTTPLRSSSRTRRHDPAVRSSSSSSDGVTTTRPRRETPAPSVLVDCLSLVLVPAASRPARTVTDPPRPSSKIGIVEESSSHGPAAPDGNHVLDKTSNMSAHVARISIATATSSRTTSCHADDRHLGDDSACDRNRNRNRKNDITGAVVVCPSSDHDDSITASWLASSWIPKIGLAVMYNLAVQHQMQSMDLAMPVLLPAPQEQSSSSATVLVLPTSVRREDAAAWQRSMLASAANLYGTAFHFLQQYQIRRRALLGAAVATAAQLPRLQPQQDEDDDQMFLQSITGIIWNNLADLHFQLGDHVVNDICRSCLEQLLIHLATCHSPPAPALPNFAVTGAAASAGDHRHGAAPQNFGTEDVIMNDDDDYDDDDDISSVATTVETFASSTAVSHHGNHDDAISSFDDHANREGMAAGGGPPPPPRLPAFVGAPEGPGGPVGAHPHQHRLRGTPPSSSSSSALLWLEIEDELWNSVTLRLWKHHLSAASA